MDTLPQQFLDILNDTANENPEYQQIYFSKEDRDSFIQKYYPQHYDSYNCLVPNAFRADVFRLLILYKYGGIYCDISIRFLTNLSSIVRFDDEFIAGIFQ